MRPSASIGRADQAAATIHSEQARRTIPAIALNLFNDDFTVLSSAGLYSERASASTTSASGELSAEGGRRICQHLRRLLFIGVVEKDMIPVAMAGVTSTNEEKTRIASSIAANICFPRIERAKQQFKMRVRRIAPVRLCCVGSLDRDRQLTPKQQPGL